MPTSLQDKLEHLPTRPGVYLFQDAEGTIVYVGKARVVHRVFGVRSCRETLNGRRPRACLQFQIHRCLAPCVVEICSPERYREACEAAALFLEGKTDEVLRRLEDQMDAAAREERF